MDALAALPNRAPGGQNIVWDFERRMRPIQPLARAPDLVRTERRSMRRGFARFRRRAKTDRRPARNKYRSVRVLRLFERSSDGTRIMTIDAGGIPAGGLEAPDLVDRVGERQGPVDGDTVVVEQHDQSVEPQMAGKRDCFLTYALHQVAVGRDDIGLVVDKVAEYGSQMSLGDGHAHRVGQTLPQRTGRRFDPRGQEIFRMTGRSRAELTKTLDLIQRDGRIASEIEQRVQQHRAVPGGMPGWPDFARSTASIASARMALAIRA